ncbi:hypothetical protein LINPERHAP2_LOCUS42319 [Linum perenne]
MMVLSDVFVCLDLQWWGNRVFRSPRREIDPHNGNMENSPEIDNSSKHWNLWWDRKSDEIPRPIPHSREVYRTGFLLNATRATYGMCWTYRWDFGECEDDKSKASMISFKKGRHMIVGSCVIRCLVPVVIECRKGATNEASNKSTCDYKMWTNIGDKMLIMCMLELVEKNNVQRGNFQITRFKELERMLHNKVQYYQLLDVPHIMSKVCYFKDKFFTLFELKEASGFG